MVNLKHALQTLEKLRISIVDFQINLSEIRCSIHADFHKHSRFSYFCILLHYLCLCCWCSFMLTGLAAEMELDPLSSTGSGEASLLVLTDKPMSSDSSDPDRK